MGNAATSEKDTREEVRSNVEEIAQIARDAAYDKVSELKAKGEEQTEVLKESIKNDPLKALLISAGVGVAIGLLMRRG